MKQAAMRAACVLHRERPVRRKDNQPFLKPTMPTLPTAAASICANALNPNASIRDTTPREVGDRDTAPLRRVKP